MYDFNLLIVQKRFKKSTKKLHDIFSEVYYKKISIKKVKNEQ